MSFLRPNKYIQHQFELAIVALILFITVYVRFFTEKLFFLPRPMQLADKPLFLFLLLLILGWKISGRKLTFVNIGWPLLLYIFVTALSALININESHPIHYIGFLNLQIEGVIFFLFIANTPFNRFELNKILKWFFIAALIQIILGLYQLPQGLSISPDMVSGTFGNNNSQMVFFLSTFTFAIFAAYLYDDSRYFLYLAPFIVVVFLAASFRAVWLVFPFTIIYIWYKSGKKRRVMPIIITSIGISTFVFFFAGAYALESSTFTKFLSFDYNIVQTSKVRTILSAGKVFAERPGALIYGTGPATYGSRGYRVFVAGAGAAKNNPTGGLLKATRQFPKAAKRYLIPAARNARMQFGSSIDSPYITYVSILVETGVLGFITFFLIYFRMFRYAVFCVKVAKSKLTFVLGLALTGAILFLVQMAFFDDWFSVERVMNPTWMLFGLLYHYRKIEINSLRG